MVKLLFLPTLPAPDVCEDCGPLAAAVLVSVLVTSAALHWMLTECFYLAAF